MGLMVAVAACTGCQATPSGGPDQVKGIDITRVRKRLEFTARIRDDNQESKVTREKTSSEERLYEENIRIEAEGSVYHPNMLEFTIAGLFGLLQEDYEETRGEHFKSSSDDGDIIEFEFEGLVLKKKNYPASVFARRNRTFEPRPFLSSMETTTDNYGFLWQYIDERTPTSLQFTHTEVRLEPLDEREEGGRQENTSLRFDWAYRFNEGNVLSFTYERQSVVEQPFDLDYDSDELTLSHRLSFGSSLQHRLDSELVYFDQRGTFMIRRTRWRNTLRLTHSEALRSWYYLEFLDRVQGNLSGVPPIGEQSYFVSGTLEHKWYESLISQLFLFGHRQEFDSGLLIKRYGIQPSLDYRKNNRWGVFKVNYVMRLEREDRQGGVQNQDVIDELGTFEDPEPIVLTNTNVMTGSIFITAEDRTTVYHLGRDYDIRRVGDRVELDRVPTGSITDGETVLIDYIFTFGGDFTLDTLTHNLTVRQNFKSGVSPYYRLRRQDQRISPVSAVGVTPEDITAQTIGVEYRRDRVHLLAEYEDHDSTISPFEAIRISADLTRQWNWGGTTRLRTRWSDVKRLEEQDRRTRFWTVEGRYRQTVGRYLTFESAVLYRNEDDTLGGVDEGVDVDLSLLWAVRETEVKVLYEYGWFEDDFTKNRSSALFFQFRRRF